MEQWFQQNKKKFASFLGQICHVKSIFYSTLTCFVRCFLKVPFFRFSILMVYDKNSAIQVWWNSFKNHITLHGMKILLGEIGCLARTPKPENHLLLQVHGSLRMHQVQVSTPAILSVFFCLIFSILTPFILPNAVMLFTNPRPINFPFIIHRKSKS